MMELLFSIQSLCYLALAAIVVQSAKFAEKIMLRKVRQFEKACELWDRNSKSKLLPVK